MLLTPVAVTVTVSRLVAPPRAPASARTGGAGAARVTAMTRTEATGPGIWGAMGCRNLMQKPIAIV